ncbi:hypoxanthine phosphoribosyltransferase [Hydrogenivirga sp. 128-5-R1-1]|uniref:hypoxanthine phosphoribosyltransferase n=1 Tax=Hydrogenivirga sp. 128-5-R1-1 TaxID=392423 RepID=UPI00015F0C4B|nr:hypoxanthine phosphoribosyltransferase [Hydrogenivirga sp. 128-5-R1-1]EDP75878.1 hypoxanthine-guanine phosphoribosyltransferase [Hydrogenivirga sp. 128-5-R1-1]
MREIRGKSLSLLIKEDDIRRRVRELGKEIEEDFSDSEDFVVVGLLKGAFVFVADLVREIDLPARIDFLWVSSYGQGMESSGSIRIVKDLDTDIEGRDVLLVDDILDTGITLREVYDFLKIKNPSRLKTCVFLDKKGRRKVEFEADYVGFEVPNVFLVGYGLDWGELGRNLKGVYAVED